MVLNRIFLVLSLLIGISIALISHAVRADILFEGYSKVLSGGVPIGYSISRYEFDNKKKQFIATTFLKTNELGGNLTESLKAYSTDDMKPVSYQYTTLIGNQTKVIDAKFEKGKMFANVTDGKKVERIQKDIPKGTFLSSFLAYVMLRSPTGFKADTKYEFQAIAEEEAGIFKGIAFIKTPENYNGLKAFRVLNEFKGSKFISLVSDKGEVFSTKAPVQGISTELVAKPTEATASFPVPAPILSHLFGDVPTGQMNELSKFINKNPNDLKQQGIPQGKGIQVKGSPTPGTAPGTVPTPAPKKGDGH